MQAAHEQRDQLERRAVGPMQVLEHDHERPVAARARDRSEHEFEQLRRLGPRARQRRVIGIELGHEPRQLRPRVAEQGVELRRRHLMRERSQRLSQRGQRHRIAAQLDAAAGDHASARCHRRTDRLFDEPGLADSRLAADDHDGRVALLGLRKSIRHGLEIPAPPDEHGTDDACHARHRRTRSGPAFVESRRDAEPRPGPARRPPRPPRADRRGGRALRRRALQGARPHRDDRRARRPRRRRADLARRRRRERAARRRAAAVAAGRERARERARPGARRLPRPQPGDAA